MRLLLTGGAGFIGLTATQWLTRHLGAAVTVLDKMTYAANPAAPALIKALPSARFHQGDIADRALLRQLFEEIKPDAVLHLAAESHVDRSIEGPEAFVLTNVLGTQVLLDETLRYWRGLTAPQQASFRYLQISTDEVYGALGPTGSFSESSPFQPNSPYAASKAGGDHLARAWHRTFGLPVIITHASNNYGPWQFPEKLIPLCLARALSGEPLPLYGDGQQVRDWLQVEDHAAALAAVLAKGRPGESYNIGGGAECTNLTLIEQLCALLDTRRPKAKGRYRDQITFVADRPGHDRRYAIDDRKLRQETGFAVTFSLADGLARTVDWYLANEAWWRDLMAQRYGGQRLGLAHRAP